jgi:hypothetical protein
VTRDFHVEGTTYSPFNGVIVGLQAGVLDKNLQRCAEIAAICNDAGLTYKGHQFRATGLPTEAALKVLFLLCISNMVYDAPSICMPQLHLVVTYIWLCVKITFTSLLQLF